MQKSASDISLVEGDNGQKLISTAALEPLRVGPRREKLGLLANSKTIWVIHDN